MGAFYWTKFRLNFRKFHVPNGTVLWLRLHRPDPSHRAFSYCSCKKYTKVRYWGDLRETIWSNGKGHFVPTDQNDQTGQSGPCTFKFRSNQTEMVHSIGCTNRNFRNFGLNWKLPTEPGHWITGNAFQISLHPIGILAMAFWTFQSWSFLNVGKHFTTQNTFSALFRWRTWPEVYFRLWHKLQSCSLSSFKDSMKFQIFGTKKGVCNQ